MRFGAFEIRRAHRGEMEVIRDKDGVYSYWLPFNASFGKDNAKFLEWSFENPVLFAVSSVICDLYSQMHITAENIESGEEVKGLPEIELLNNPNYFQSKQDFLYQQKWFQNITGNSLVYQIRPNTKEVPRALYNLVPSEVDYKDVMKIKSFIKTKEEQNAFERQQIKYRLDNQDYNILVRDLIPLYDVANGLKCNSMLKSPSRVESIARNLCNIDEAIKAKNINLQMSQKYLAVNKTTFTNGGSGIISEEDRESIENVIRARSIQITNGNVEIKHLVSDLKKLWFDEMFAAEAATVCNAFGLNKDVISYYMLGSTYENQEQGIIRFIQNKIQADADNAMNSYTNSWGLAERGIKLKANYSHLPVMQALMNTKIESFTKYQEGLAKAIENQTISVEDAKKMTNKMRKELGI